MNQKPSEQRRFERYSAEVEVLFQVAYPLQTKLNFQIIDQESGELNSSKYSATGKNIGIEGMCFTTSLRLEPGEQLYLEILLEDKKEPIPMEAQVRWARQCVLTGVKDRLYDIGAKILRIKGQPVSETFQKDASGEIVWSGVLQTIFGDIKSISKQGK